VLVILLLSVLYEVVKMGKAKVLRRALLAVPPTFSQDTLLGPNEGDSGDGGGGDSEDSGGQEREAVQGRYGAGGAGRAGRWGWREGPPSRPLGSLPHSFRAGFAFAAKQCPNPGHPWR